jgi:hypothetical protein
MLFNKITSLERQKKDLQYKIYDLQSSNKTPKKIIEETRRLYQQINFIDDEIQNEKTSIVLKTGILITVLFSLFLIILKLIL